MSNGTQENRKKTLNYVFSGSGSGRPYCRKYSPQDRSKDNVCVVIDDCEVVYASESERLTKRKHDYLIPLDNLRLFKTYSPLAENAELTLIDTDDAPCNHHEDHIYEVFYQSGFSEAAVLVVDGYGNLEESVTLAYIKENEAPVIFKKYGSKNSPGRVYATAAEALFGKEDNEGKLMGLTAYGKDNGKKYLWYDDQNDYIGADFYLLIDDVTSKHKESANDGDVMFAKDIAFTVQKNFEETILAIVKHFKNLLVEKGIKTENLCLSGGTILNCPTNSRIISLGLFDNYYASPQPSDGCANSVGRAFRNMQFRGETLKSKRLKTPYLGVTYPRNEIYNPFDIIDNPIYSLVKKLWKGEILAWYQGGAEWGPRALGHRSFLADPTSSDMLDAVNKIKGREPWRPLAPIFPDRLFRLVFDVKNTDMCEYMLRTLQIKDEWQEKLKAVCHVDGSTRPQILKRDLNPQLHDLLMTYFDKTGIPCLINTSLNINGFPIVESPSDFSFLYDEIEAIPDIPPVNAIFVDENDFYEIKRLEILQPVTRKKKSVPEIMADRISQQKPATS